MTAFIDGHRDAHGIELMCRVLQIAPSTYYAHAAVKANPALASDRRKRDIVWVPFPFVEAPRMRDRPALVVSTKTLGGAAELLWVLMITSAENEG